MLRNRYDHFLREEAIAVAFRPFNITEGSTREREGVGEGYGGERRSATGAVTSPTSTVTDGVTLLVVVGRRDNMMQCWVAESGGYKTSGWWGPEGPQDVTEVRVNAPQETRCSGVHPRRLTSYVHPGRHRGPHLSPHAPTCLDLHLKVFPS